VADELAGRTGPCVQCGGTITVPVAGASAYSVPPRSSSGSLVVIVLAVVALVAILICGGMAAFVWLLWARSESVVEEPTEVYVTEPEVEELEDLEMELPVVQEPTEAFDIEEPEVEMPVEVAPDGEVDGELPSVPDELEEPVGMDATPAQGSEAGAKTEMEERD